MKDKKNVKWNIEFQLSEKGSSSWKLSHATDKIIESMILIL